jgi:hypothetical protein
MNNIFSVILLFLIGMVFGWIFAHSTVATECEKLNSFYVGDKIYHCGVKSK